MSNPTPADPSGPDPHDPAGVWPPAQAGFHRGRGRARAMLAIGVAAMITGGVLLAVRRDCQGTAATVDALLTGGALAIIAGAGLLHQWSRTRRALAISPRWPARVRLEMTPATQGLYDLLFDDGPLALARNSVRTGNLTRSGLLHTTGYSTLPDPVHAFVAGDPANPTVLTSRNGTVLLPLRGPRTPGNADAGNTAGKPASTAPTNPDPTRGRLRPRPAEPRCS